MTIAEKLAQAAAIRAELAELAPVVEKFKQTELDLKILKGEILADLSAQNLRATDYVNGLRATKTRRTELVVTDPNAFFDFVEANAPDPRVYLRVDTRAAASFARQYAQKVGHDPSGAEFQTKESLRFEEQDAPADINPLLS